MSHTQPPVVSHKPASTIKEQQKGLLSKLWIYTNYNCNLSCSYCCANSNPHTPAQAISLEVVKAIIEEAQEIGFKELFFTGGEPFILESIFDILAYASKHLKTTVLTNAMLFKGRRLKRLAAIGPHNLTMQVSLDGGRPEHHDAYRGEGTWTKTVAGMQTLQEHGFQLRLSTTETPANSPYLAEICTLHNSMGIPEQDHFTRPLAKRGFSQEGVEVSKSSIVPEMTINRDGVFWHPLSTDADMQVSKELFPLSQALNCIQEELEVIAAGGVPQNEFT